MSDQGVLTDKQVELCETSDTDYSDLKAMYINCTLKRSPELSHTQGLMDKSIAIMEKNGVQVDQMDPLRSRILPALGCRPRITESLFRAGAPLNQLHRLSAGDVDRRQQDEPVGTRRRL